MRIFRRYSVLAALPILALLALRPGAHASAAQSNSSGAGDLVALDSGVSLGPCVRSDTPT